MDIESVMRHCSACKLSIFMFHYSRYYMEKVATTL